MVTHRNRATTSTKVPCSGHLDCDTKHKLYESLWRSSNEGFVSLLEFSSFFPVRGVLCSLHKRAEYKRFKSKCWPKHTDNIIHSPLTYNRSLSSSGQVEWVNCSRLTVTARGATGTGVSAADLLSPYLLRLKNSHIRPLGVEKNERSSKTRQAAVPWIPTRRRWQKRRDVNPFYFIFFVNA